MRLLLGAGLAAAILGLIAFVYGYPISDTSFGNAMMIDGVIVLCTGLLIMALSVVQQQLERLTDRLGAPLSGVAAAEIAPVPATSMGGAFDMPAPPSFEPSMPERASAAPPLFPTAEAAAADPVHAPEAEAEPPQAEPEPPAAPERAGRRNLLFESRRRDRATPVAAAPAAAEAEGAAAARSFDDAWSGTPPAAPQPAAPTVIKSGVVDGMSYSLYSDGSIEAQMPHEGLMRFASLDALREYLDQRP